MMDNMEDVYDLSKLIKQLHKFFLAECIKRHFEYYEDKKKVEWLADFWNFPLRIIVTIDQEQLYKSIIDSDIYVQMSFFNDFIMYYHHQHKNWLPYEGEGVKEYKQFYDLIIEQLPDWCKKVYDISCKYRLSFAELIHPFDIKNLFDRNLITEDSFNKFWIPTFLPNTAKYQDNLIIGDKDGTIYIGLKIAEDFDLALLVRDIAEQISLFYLDKYGLDGGNKKNRYYIENIFKDIVKSNDKSNKKNNTYNEKFMGLVIYDILLGLDKKKRKRPIVLQMIKENYMDKGLGWKCSNNRDKEKDKKYDHCKGCDACKYTYIRNLNCVYRSIQNMREESIKNDSVKLDENRTILLERITMPSRL